MAEKRRTGKPRRAAGSRRIAKRDLPAQAYEVRRRLAQHYPDARTALAYENPLQLLVATILSAQCTDQRVNEVTKDLFRAYRSAKDFADAPLDRLEEDIRPTGFYRNKAKAIKACCAALVERYGGEVPASMEALVELEGVGRKTAAVVLGNGFGINEGVAVDTHVRRVAWRLGLTEETNPEKIEADLIRIIPREEWTHISNRLIEHGRRLCYARKPDCPACFLNDICPSAQL